MSLAYLNGTWDALEHTKISVLDRGFLFADSVYEVIAGYRGCPLFLEEHWARLCAGLAKLNIAVPLTFDSYREIIQKLITDMGTTCVYVYLQITRGVQKKRAHALEAGEVLTPNVLAFAYAYELYTPAVLAKGFSAIVLPDDRWSYGSIKSTSLLPNTLAAQEAKTAEAQEAFLVHDGLVIEGTASNVFIVKRGVVTTPPLVPRMLPGITRAQLLALMKEQGMACQEAPITVEQLYDADEVWMTGTLHGPRAITQLDGKPVGSGVAGPVWHAVSQLYLNRLDALTNRDPACMQ